ncbi:MAG: hypothetical protein H6Q33_4534 [Deltaproteobacteria bacterium]|nr:hypothetical protein [Deltaproteobacteria bacterium]
MATARCPTYGQTVIVLSLLLSFIVPGRAFAGADALPSGAVELAFASVGAGNADLVLRKDTALEWVKQYTKKISMEGADESQTVKGHKVSTAISVAFADIDNNGKTDVVVRAPAIGPGFDDVLNVYLAGSGDENKYNKLLWTSVNHGQMNLKYYLVPAHGKDSFGRGQVFKRLMVQEQGKLRPLFEEAAELAGSDIVGLLKDCAIDLTVARYKALEYSILITEGKLRDLTPVHDWRIKEYQAMGGSENYVAITVDSPPAKVQAWAKKQGMKVPKVFPTNDTCSINPPRADISQGASPGHAVIACGCLEAE